MLEVRVSWPTLQAWRTLLPYGRYLDGAVADEVLADLFKIGTNRYRAKCRARGIPVDYPISGIRKPAKPMPDLSPKPIPRVDT